MKTNIVLHKKLLKELTSFNLEYRLHNYYLVYYYNNYEIKIYYSNYLPIKFLINNINILKINNYYLNEYILNKSILFKEPVSSTIYDIHKELDKIIQFNYKKHLLKKIIDKYSNENMDYLYNYLL